MAPARTETVRAETATTEALATARRPVSPAAVAGFVVALVGAVIAAAPAVGVMPALAAVPVAVPWIASALGLVLSLVAATSVDRPRRLTGAGGVVLGIVGLFFCALAASALIANTMPSSWFSSSPAPAASAAYRSGTYAVGSGFAAGRYRTDGAPGEKLTLCSATRLDAAGGAKAFPETTVAGSAVVTVAATDAAVKFSGPCTWSKVR